MFGFNEAEMGNLLENIGVPESEMHFVKEQMKVWYDGFKVSKASRDLAKFGNEVNQSCLQPGDLAFFKGRSTKSSDVGHVALVINAFGDRFDMIHATVGKGIWIDRNVMDIAYYKQRFLMFRRPFEIK